jgi:hypothetical protein
MYVHGSGESPLIAGTESEDRHPKDTTTLYTMQLLHSWEVIFVTHHGPTSKRFSPSGITRMHRRGSQTGNVQVGHVVWPDKLILTPS